jgi:hypothetical protein
MLHCTKKEGGSLLLHVDPLRHAFFKKSTKPYVTARRSCAQNDEGKVRHVHIVFFLIRQMLSLICEQLHCKLLRSLLHLYQILLPPLL